MAFLAPESKISGKQKNLISKLCQSSTELKHTMSLVKKFRELIETKTGNELNAWIAEANHSVIGKLKSFAVGLLSDIKSIEMPSIYIGAMVLLRAMLTNRRLLNVKSMEG